jgi:hypothetical protein
MEPKPIRKRKLRNLSKLYNEATREAKEYQDNGRRRRIAEPAARRWRCFVFCLFSFFMTFSALCEEATFSIQQHPSSASMHIHCAEGARAGQTGMELPV